MFGRGKPETTSPTPAPVKTGGKGRPTPSRKEAEAAARARAKTPRTRRELAAARRAERAENSQQIRAARRSGDERYLPPRDKGPVRRFVRDFVDSRMSFVELMVPLLIVTMVLGYSGNARLASFGSTLLFGTMLLIAVDMLVLRFRLRRELGRRFPEAPTRGTTYYALTRAIQMRFLRLPKPQVKIGKSLPDRYR